MKLHLVPVLVALACSAACSRKDDDPQILAKHAEDLATYYKPKIDGFAKSVLEIQDAAKRLPKPLPGAEEAERAWVDAKDQVIKLQDELAKDPKAAQAIADDTSKSLEERAHALERFVQDEQHKLEAGATFVEENLAEAEAFVSNAMRTIPADKLLAPPASGSGAPTSQANDALAVP